jgi:hypothetical protein
MNISNQNWKMFEAVVAQSQDEGIWDHDAYFHGVANGFIMALATLKGIEPKLLERPARYRTDPKGEK